MQYICAMHKRTPKLIVFLVLAGLLMVHAYYSYTLYDAEPITERLVLASEASQKFSYPEFDFAIKIIRIVADLMHPH
jgi:hypothetical protein